MINQTSPKIVAIYARYSTDKQNEATIDAQIEACKEYCEKQGWIVGPVYYDKAITGSTSNRPYYQEMKSRVETGEFNIVLATHLDRLYRDNEESAGFFKYTNYFDVEIWTPIDGYCDELKHSMHGMINAQYTKTTAAHTKNNMNNMLKLNRNMGGLAYGYESYAQRGEHGIKVRGFLRINEDQAEIVRRIFQEYNAGKSPQKIEAGLNDDGIAPPRGDFWRQSAINGNRQRGTGILNNELYIGTHVWNRQTYKRHPITKNRTSRLNPESEWKHRQMPDLRIVDQLVWDKVKARQASISTKTDKQRANATSRDLNKLSGAGAARRNTSLLSGILFCGECGGTITASSGGRVVCSTALESGASVCKNKTHYKRDNILNMLFETLQTEFMQPAALELFAKEYNSAIKRINAEQHKKHKRFRNELAQVEKEIANVIHPITQGILNASVQSKLTELEQRQKTLGAILSLPEAIPMDMPADIAKTYSERVRSLSESMRDSEYGQEAKEALQGLIKNITLHPRKDRGTSEFDLDVEGVLASLLHLAGIEERASEAMASETLSEELVCGGQIYRTRTLRLLRRCLWPNCCNLRFSAHLAQIKLDPPAIKNKTALP